MSAFELQNAIGDTLLEMVLQQKAQTKKQRELLLTSQTTVTGLSSKVYAKAV